MNKNIIYFLIILVALLIGYLIISYEDSEVNTRGSLAKTENIYSGIEVGSSGVKYSVVQLEVGDASKVSYKILKEDNHDYDENFIFQSSLSKGDSEEIRNQLINSFAGITSYYDTKGLELDWNNFYIALSNDYNRVNNITEIVFDFIKYKYPSFNIDSNLDILDSPEEGKSNFLTTYCSSEFPFRQDDILDIDIGTGSTKFTTLYEGRVTSYSRILIDKNDLVVGADYPINLITNRNFDVYSYRDRRNIETLVLSELRKTVRDFIEDHPEFNEKKKIVFTGGLPYKVFTLSVQNIEGNFHTFHIEECLSTLLERIKNSQDFLEGKNKNKLYTQQFLLQSIFLGLGEMNFNKSYYFFQRKSWIPGYIIHKSGLK